MNRYLVIIPILTTIYFIYQIIKHKNNIVKSIKIIFEIIASKDFWQYVASLKWLFRR